MANILKIAPSNSTGSRVITAIDQMRQGVGTLRELDGLRANAIGTSQTEMKSVFGTATTDDAQGLSDRWSAFLTALYDPNNGAYSHFALLRDLIEAVSYETA
ncbi:MAG: hypothetical protein GC204_21450 [Chloroflexi bacterium]|nr:hypothetical protein [Chloroflexota bacterium]